MPSQWKQIIKPRSIYDPHGFRERRLSTGFCHLRIGFSSNPEKNDDWAKGQSLLYGGFDSSKWRREQGIDYGAYSGQRIWPLLSKDHDAQVDVSDWTIFRVIDQGIRHPTVCLWCAVNARGDRHIFREYYATNRSIGMNCRAILALSEEVVDADYIDPSTRRRNSETLKPLILTYEENGLFCNPADNSFAGYDSVANAILSTIARKALRTGILPPELEVLRPDQNQLVSLAEQPALTFDLRFASRCFEECCNLRWQETKGDLSQIAPREKPVDKDDDGPDCVRYAVQSPLYFAAKTKGVLKIDSFRKMTQLKRTIKRNEDAYKRQENRAYV